MQALQRARITFEIEIDELRQVAARLNSEFSRAVKICSNAIEQQAKVIVVGIGKSGNIGQKIVATLNSTGTPAVNLNSQDALHGDLGVVRDGDVVLALSHSGETSELLNLLPFIKRFKVQLIGMTGKTGSTLAQLSDVVLDTGVSREACPLNLAPTSSSTAMLVMGDALAMAILEERGFTEEDFAKYHPGGSLGRALLTRVGDIMRSGAELAMIGNDSTVSDALAAMTNARCGACVVTQPDGSLAGIFTHGDFVRAYQKDALVGQKGIEAYMTRSPVSVRAQALAAEAVSTLGQRRIDDLVVLDEEGRPVGLVDTQDLARLKLV